ncbi:putative actin monomer binding protein [Aspergillus campestris IBT 28561]|uniref:Twinfilin n=1 Tax=Aspergillus campestris (strain IBT 28561) TaxID=1392248 RepID=A0A2I1CQQ6_ASPC2|nr:putative actin monomer binding protein [Aspergillus campestris IBT 28561]PKX99954.1 putative actin monomer binding protein [Aspergillus campestris IBT 28561]
MQSGISVSPELHNAFTSFTSDDSIFCLPVTITTESLQPLTPIPFSTPNDFYASLPKLASILEPKTPLYLLLRRPSSSAAPTLIALTYIPSNAPVRAKTLFASTRATLARELGTEKFGATIFATEEDEVVGEEAWRERDAETDGSTGVAAAQREQLMGDKERELDAVRRAEDEARSGTPGRDIGIGGSFNRAGGPSGMRVSMPVEEDAKEALAGLQQGGLVQLAIDIPRETFTLAASEAGVDAGSVQSHISPSAPQYTFYHYPDSDVVIFVYTCPSGSSIKQRMLYASSRMSALHLAQQQGLNISKKIEASSPDEISEERLHEEVHPARNDGINRGFARPRRPGR